MSSQALLHIGIIGLASYVLVDIAKRAGLRDRFAGVLSLVSGVVIGVLSHLILQQWWLEGFIEGFLAAAASSGIYSALRALFKRKKSQSIYPDDPKLHPPC